MFDMLTGISNVLNANTQQGRNSQILNTLNNDDASLKTSTKYVSDRVEAADDEFQAERSRY